MTLGYFSAGDSPFFFSEQLRQISWLPKIWDATTGFGRNVLVQLWIDYPIRLFIKLCATIGLDWWAIDKILWIGTLLLAVFSIWKLSMYVFRSRQSSVLSVIIYCFNTYALMLFEGGQRGVLFAYALAPYILYRFIAKKEEHVKNGLFFAVLVSFDLRLAYLCLMAVGIYVLICESNIMRRFYGICVSLVITALIHAFWILPLVVVRGGVSLGEEYTGQGMLRFLSVADFSHAIAFLHPNWPENLFGKVYFLQPEFLIIPVIAFSSLLAISHHKKQMLYFPILALAGVFLAKGVQEPFGQLYAWCFAHVPGFIMFRDPTKFYLYIALGYSILIPHSLELLRANLKRFISIPGYTISLLFIAVWFISIRLIFSGTLGGNFTPKSVPDEYVRLKDMLVQDASPSRVLWLPVSQKFAYSSDTHPMIQAQDLFKMASVSGIADILATSSFQNMLHNSGIKYVIVPTDIWSQIFLKNYTYDPIQRERIILALKNTQLQQDTGYVDLKIFVNNSYTYTNGVPSVVKKQEYWVTIGLYVSIITMVTSIGYCSLRKRGS